MKKILFCPLCRTYTLKENCRKCGAKTINNQPAKFTYPDKYAEIRLKEKQNVQDKNN